MSIFDIIEGDAGKDSPQSTRRSWSTLSMSLQGVKSRVQRESNPPVVTGLRAGHSRIAPAGGRRRYQRRLLRCARDDKVPDQCGSGPSPPSASSSDLLLSSGCFKLFYCYVFLLCVLRALCGEDSLLSIPINPDPTKFLTFRLHGNRVRFVKPCGEMTERPKVLAC